MEPGQPEIGPTTASLLNHRPGGRLHAITDPSIRHWFSRDSRSERPTAPIQPEEPGDPSNRRARPEAAGGGCTRPKNGPAAGQPDTTGQARALSGIHAPAHEPNHTLDTPAAFHSRSSSPRRSPPAPAWARHEPVRSPAGSPPARASAAEPVPHRAPTLPAPGPQPTGRPPPEPPTRSASIEPIPAAWHSWRELPSHSLG
jgi:hypothetical protein